MAYKLAVLLALVAVAASVDVTSNKIPSLEAGPGFTRVYQYKNSKSPSHDFSTYQPDLSKVGWNNYISSSCSTGIWVYYDKVNYNLGNAAAVIWNHGIQFCADMPASFDNTASSLRYAGSPKVLDGSSFTLYDAQGFMGNEFYGEASVPDLRSMAAKGQSLVITGTSKWTFYSGESYKGTSVCSGPTTTDTKGSVTMHVGLYKTLASSWTNSIRSARKGCYSTTMMEAEPLEVSHQDENGATGSFMVQLE